MKLKKLFVLVPLLALSLTGCEGGSTNAPSSSPVTEDDPYAGYDDGLYNDDIDNGYHYSISIDKSDVPEYLEVGGPGFTLKINMSTDEPGASTTPSEDTLVIHNTDSNVVQLDGLNVIPVGRGTTTLKVEWLHHSSCYDHINVIVRNVGEVDESGYTYSINITNKDALPEYYYVGMEPVTLEFNISSNHPDFDGIEASFDSVRVTSSDESIIEVDNWTLKPVGIGRATIRALFVGHESTYESLIIEVGTKPILNYTLNFTITYNGEGVTCPEYGDIYMNYSLVDTLGNWASSDNWIPLTYLDTPGSYSTTFSQIPWGDYEYNLCFVYEGEEPSYLNQLTDINGSFTVLEDAEDNTSQSLTASIALDLSTLLPHDEEHTLYNYTLEFEIRYGGYSQQTQLGWNVYIAGNFNGWTFETLQYHEITEGSDWHYTYTFDVIYAGSYEYKLVYCWAGGESDGWANGTEITPGTTNQVFTVLGNEGNDYTNLINISCPFSFYDVDGRNY